MLRHELTDSGIQSPIDATTSPEPSSKKRKATYSARGVASLTPEQLAKKRANDREAQRAIRERTKAQIESLERQIQELTSQQPYQELQTVIRQKDAIQAENDEIRRRLASVLSIIQPIIGAQGLTGKSILAALWRSHLTIRQQISPLQHKAIFRMTTLTSTPSPSTVAFTSTDTPNSILYNLSRPTYRLLRRRQNRQTISNHTLATRCQYLSMNANGRQMMLSINSEIHYSGGLS
jgi:TolA-binding protein